jgi:hypothetical protein
MKYLDLSLILKKYFQHDASSVLVELYTFPLKLIPSLFYLTADLEFEKDHNLLFFYSCDDL